VLRPASWAQTRLNCRLQPEFRFCSWQAIWRGKLPRTPGCFLAGAALVDACLLFMALHVHAAMRRAQIVIDLAILCAGRRSPGAQADFDVEADAEADARGLMQFLRLFTQPLLGQRSSGAQADFDAEADGKSPHNQLLDKLVHHPPMVAGRRSPGAQADFDAEADAEATEEVENLLESYFIQVDRAFNRLRSLGMQLHHCRLLCYARLPNMGLRDQLRRQRNSIVAAAPAAHGNKL